MRAQWTLFTRADRIAGNSASTRGLNSRVAQGSCGTDAIGRGFALTRQAAGQQASVLQEVAAPAGGRSHDSSHLACEFIQDSGVVRRNRDNFKADDAVIPRFPRMSSLMGLGDIPSRRRRDLPNSARLK